MDQSLSQVIDEVSKFKGIEKDEIIRIIEESMKEAAKKYYGSKTDLDAIYNVDSHEIEVYEFKIVKDTVEDPDFELSIEKAKEIDPDVIEGDELGIILDTSPLGRIAAQIAKQVLLRRIRNAESEIICQEFSGRKGQLTNGSVRRIEGKRIFVDLGRAEGILKPEDQLPRETYRRSDRILCYIKDVIKDEKRGTQIILSRTCREFVQELFVMNVPEIAEGIVEIKAIARDPGSRSKIAVFSRENDVDPLGACVGIRGSRVQSIVQELKGEKIDIVPFDHDPARYVCNALSPAVVSKVLVDETNNTMEIIVPDDQLSLAIGRKGQNVSLAAQLTEWKIDITSESKLKKEKLAVKEKFDFIEDLDDSALESLFNYRLRTIAELAQVGENYLMGVVPELSMERAKTILQKAREINAEKQQTINPVTEHDIQKNHILSALKGKKLIELTPLDRMLMVTGVDDDIRQQLSFGGISSVEDLAGHEDYQKLAEITGLDEEKVDELLDAAELFIKVEAELKSKGN